MADHEAAIVTDDRYPGWRARLVHDEDAEPYGDALAPALLVPSCGLPLFAKSVYVPEQAERILAAWSRLADHDLFGRYLRIFHGVTTVAVATSPDLDVVVFDTGDFRRHVGITAAVADLSGEQAEWRAWLDGEVYGVVVERHHTGTITWDDDTTTAASAWREVDAVWGLFGRDIAHQVALDLLQNYTAG